MSKEMKKMISKVLICCMLLSASYTGITANAVEADEAQAAETQVEQAEEIRQYSCGFFAQFA